MVLSVNSKDPEETTRWLFPGNLVCPNPLSNFRRLIKALHQGFPLFPTATVPISLAENLAPPCTQILDYKQTRLTLISFF
jgi:hypothetical protein